MPPTSANMIQSLLSPLHGLKRALAGQALPYARGDWYWNPSRALPAGPGKEITEFPFFTFLYGDLHAHMIAMPLALLVLSWALSTVRARMASWVSLLVGAVVIGALYPTNLPDLYTYLPIALVALAYGLWRADRAPKWRIELSDSMKKRMSIVCNVLLLAALSVLLYAPYRAFYSQVYGSLVPWTASRTPIWVYFTHWGVFLFVITTWMAWETRQWMAQTPVSALNKLRPFRVIIRGILAILFVVLIYLAYSGLQIAWIALPLAFWSGILLLRPSMPDTKRFVLFLVGTSCLITLTVELAAVNGDIGRMNTIFKFYLQAWILLSISAGAAVAWTLPDSLAWSKRWRGFYYVATVLLLSGAALYTIIGTADKIADRTSSNVPLTLDGITYMQHAQYSDFGATMDLERDYRAIRWMQDNVQGSPVIVEANCPEYRWCARFTVYTGLPGVIGWNWHQRQQRAFSPQLVQDRVEAVSSFYATTDEQVARDFLKKYEVKYVVVGQLERAEYPKAGVDKFERYDGQLWRSVYRDGDTVIYRVL
jgi:YYY domain-containing protein